MQGIQKLWALAALLLTATWVWAEGDRYALVVGNAAYEAPATLKNPVNDATDMAAALKLAGWSVSLVTDADRRAFLRAIAALRDNLAGHEGAQALFYYAGHGMQVDGSNYLIPVKTPFDTVDDVRSDAISVQNVTDAITAAKASVSLLILDACRDNPFAKKMSRSLGGTRGLTVVNGAGGASGSAILFSTSPGDVAQDGTGRNGVFTAALLNYIGSDLTIEDLFKKVTGEVRKVSGGGQNPWINVSLSSDFYFISDAIRASRAAEAQRQTEAADRVAREAARAAEAETQRVRVEAAAAKQAAAAALEAQRAAEAKVQAEASRPRGKVRIESFDSGQVYLQGEWLGDVGPDSPLVADSLPPGRQEFRFVAPGQREVVKAATLSEKAYTTVTFGTAPAAAAGLFPGSLSVSVNVEGALASLDDADEVALPHVFEGLIPGEHTLVVRDVPYESRYYAGFEQKVTVVAGRQVKVKQELQLGRARLRLNGFPEGSTLAINDQAFSLEPQPDAARTVGFDGTIEAGSVKIVVVADNITYSGNFWLESTMTYPSARWSWPERSLCSERACGSRARPKISKALPFSWTRNSPPTPRRREVTVWPTPGFAATTPICTSASTTATASPSAFVR
jgi:uncharacterized caspase-like protein